MKEKKYAVLREKMIDYKRFAFTLVCVSVFFYLGVLIPSPGKEDLNNFLMMGATIVFLAGASLFFYLSNQCKKALAEFSDESGFS
ncbi:YrhC family protein [Peribacillus tepidiphilus]|uniref:YrhC family protein n=1 Tax=Peribacillus tepidiphilus TaxID=2652445 RepID=UPI001290CBAC|nr:YrhC family protein [Peribacillus tepidiphilus]